MPSSPGRLSGTIPYLGLLLQQEIAPANKALLPEETSFGYYCSPPTLFSSCGMSRSSKGLSLTWVETQSTLWSRSMCMGIWFICVTHTNHMLSRNLLNMTHSHKVQAVH